MSDALLSGPVLPAALTIAAMLATPLLRRRVRLYALATGLTDVPNARSSHAVPTPRGGGLAVVATFVALTLVLGCTHLVPWRPVAALVVGGVAVAAVGFYDDRHTVSARARLVVQALASVVALALLGGAPAVPLGGRVWEPGSLGWAVAGVLVVWLINLYNFMDGIDGIAAGETAAVGLGAAVVAGVTGAATGVALWPLLLGAVGIGYLAGNRGPGRIFLGDVGSGFLGWTMAVLLLWSAHQRPALLWSWLILLSVFTVDATLTLLRRWARGVRVSEAHRSHAYQRAARYAGRHAPVSLATAGLTLVWLLPLATYAARHPETGLATLLVASTPLGLLWWYLGGGLPDAPAPTNPVPRRAGTSQSSSV